LPLLKISDFDRSTKLLYDKPRPQAGWTAKHKLGVVVLANSSSAGSVVGKVAKEALQLALETKTGIRQSEQKKKEVETGQGVVKIPPDQLQTYAGTYDTSVGIAKVSYTSGSLQVEAMDKTLFLSPRADGLFSLKYRILGIIPISLGELDNIGISQATISGHDILKARRDGTEFLAGERIKHGPISEKWRQSTGEYEVVNPGEDTMLIDKIYVRHDQDHLYFDFSLPLFTKETMTWALCPLSDSEAIICGLGRGKGETIRLVDATDGTIFRYSGYLFKRKK
jgi:hypothetical protein